MHDAGQDFIRRIIAKSITAGNTHIHTRFPPEPNGYLHIGHAKAISLNFDIAEECSGLCNLRMDDTNPVRDYEQYIAAIQDDIRWLGYSWEDRLFFASDYFDILYEYACTLIKKKLAYVDNQTAEEIRTNRGTPTEAGKDSIYRTRSVEENLQLFEAMKNGNFADGECVLRAKIDMAAPNITMRDPTIYRIRHLSHPRSATAWCIYPMYDFAHSLSDAQEGITHSLCTLEFEERRPLYKWFLQQLDIKNPPQQIEFARLNMSYTVLSKRKLSRLVQEQRVDGWDDPRMPTIAGMRRRGYPASVIRAFCREVGITKVESIIDAARLESMLRTHLNIHAQRRIAVFKPLKLKIVNYPEDKTEVLSVENNPEDDTAGMRNLLFSQNLFIEQDDFMMEAPKKFFRLYPGNTVRLKYAYCVRCVDVVLDKAGNPAEILCEYDPETRGGDSKGLKIRGTLHWLSADACEEAELYLYDHLFLEAIPEEQEDFFTCLNPESLNIITALVEKDFMKTIQPDTAYQFLRHGYFFLDKNSNGKKILNRIITLKDSWKKIQKKNE